MKNLLIYSLIILAIIGCKDSFKNKSKTEIIRYKGMDGQSVYLCFISPKIGYSFNNKTITDWDKVTDEQLDDPNYFPKSTDEATIYKTTDGGKNWKKINSILSYKYFDIATVFNNDVYILRSDEREDFKFNITQFNILNYKVKNLNEINPISSLWNDNEKVFYTNNWNTINLYSLDNKQRVDSATIKDYVLFGLSLKSMSYAIFSDKERTYFGNINKTNQEIKLPITPTNITKQDKNTILIAGNTINDDNEISLVSYDVNTKQSRIIKRFKNYSIIQDLQSNDKAIVGFIGNIKGAFTEYDMFYSLDKGKTWNLHKLEDRFSIKPNCLLDNVLYINGGVITKIYLQ